MMKMEIRYYNNMQRDWRYIVKIKVKTVIISIRVPVEDKEMLETIGSGKYSKGFRQVLTDYKNDKFPKGTHGDPVVKHIKELKIKIQDMVDELNKLQQPGVVSLNKR